jgi:hypothetical protein
MFFENDSKMVFSSFLIATFFKNENCMMSKLSSSRVANNIEGCFFF